MYRGLAQLLPVRDMNIPAEVAMRFFLENLSHAMMSSELKFVVQK